LRQARRERAGALEQHGVGRAAAQRRVVLGGGADHDDVWQEGQEVALELAAVLLGGVADHAGVEHLDAPAALEQAGEDLLQPRGPGLVLADGQAEGAAVTHAHDAQCVRAVRPGGREDRSTGAQGVDGVVPGQQHARPQAVVEVGIPDGQLAVGHPHVHRGGGGLFRRGGALRESQRALDHAERQAQHDQRQERAAWAAAAAAFFLWRHAALTSLMEDPGYQRGGVSRRPDDRALCAG
jgi:hypothetical protein